MILLLVMGKEQGQLGLDNATASLQNEEAGAEGGW